MSPIYSIRDKVKYRYNGTQMFGSIMKVEPDQDTFRYLIRPHTNHISQINYIWVPQVDIIQSLYRVANDS